MSVDIESLAPKGPEIARPPGFFLVWGMLVAALALNLMPWSRSLLGLRPDFVAVALLYWSGRQPLRIGMSVGFLLGLATDVGAGTLLGQHALAYVFTAWVGEVTSRRLIALKLWQQVLQIFPILFLAQLIVLVAGMFSGGPVLEWAYLLSPLPGTALWWAMAKMLAVESPKVPAETT